MRVFLFAVAAAVAFPTPAGAQTIENISYSPEFQVAIDEEFGAREGDYLKQVLARYVADAHARRNVSANGARIELSIIDAAPNRPTFQQTFDQPGLDSFRSVSIGGADLRAVLRDRSGAVIGEVEHRYYSHDIRDAAYAGTWTDARRAMRRFAEKVADAYVTR